MENYWISDRQDIRRLRYLHLDHSFRKKQAETNNTMNSRSDKFYFLPFIYPVIPCVYLMRLALFFKIFVGDLFFIKEGNSKHIKENGKTIEKKKNQINI